MNKIIITGLMALQLTSAFGAANPKDSIECPSGTQNNILIHGIGGSQSSFGSMNTVLDKNMPCSKSYFFEYDTKNSRLNNLDFANSLNLFLNKIKTTKEKDLNFIMHSQGGLVGLTFLLESYNKSPGFNRNYKRINKFVSMSTPFWGSDFAMMGQKVFFNLDFQDNDISPFGKGQLRDMEYGSQFLKNQIKKVFQKNSKGFLDFLKEQIKILNISAMAPFSKRFLKYFGSQFFEGDMIVNIPSMTLNTLNANDLSINYTEGTSKELATIQNKVSSQAYVSGTHMDVYYGTLGYGVVDVPEECIELKECDHPGLKTLFAYLTKDEVLESKRIKKAVRGFDLHVQIKFPAGSKGLDESYIRISERNKQEIDVGHYRLNVDNFEPITINTNDSSAYYLVKGNLWGANELADIEFEVHHEGSVTRTVKVKVQKGRATFVELKMKNN
jgi:pimeloyl-ACP methyl ester carboxylesterase